MEPEAELQIRWRTHGLTARVRSVNPSLPRNHLLATAWPPAVLVGLWLHVVWVGPPPLLSVGLVLPAPLLMVWEFSRMMRLRLLVLEGEVLTLEGVGRWRLSGYDRVEAVASGLELRRGDDAHALVPLVLHSESARRWLASQLQQATGPRPAAPPGDREQRSRLEHLLDRAGPSIDSA
jgi:hypothetical protein